MRPDRDLPVKLIPNEDDRRFEPRLYKSNDLPELTRCPSQFSETELVNAHSHSSHNLEEVQKSSECGCFSCLKIFSPSEVTEWLEDGTVLCPDCSIDSVLGSMSGYHLTKDFLAEMNGRWFRSTRRLSRQKKARNVKVEIAVIAITGLVTEILLPNNSWVLILVIAGLAGVLLFAIYENLRIKRKVRSGGLLVNFGQPFTGRGPTGWEKRPVGLLG